MKASGKCPKCSNTALYYSPQIMDRGDGNEANPLAIGRTDAIHARIYGQFEVYACRSCGLAELYVLEANKL